MVSYSTGVKGESVGWHGGEGDGCGAEVDTGKRWGETRPYEVGLFRIAGRLAGWAHAMRPTELFQKKSKRNKSISNLGFEISNCNTTCGEGQWVSVFKVPDIIIIEGRFF
jgi:hypothetical protein